MAVRKVFRVSTNDNFFVETVDVNFKWSPGFAVSQKQKNIIQLHDEYKKIYENDNILEISTKSPNELGVKLSAFNLNFTTSKGRTVTVESAFQASKKFENGGPYIDILKKDSKSAKKDERLNESGKLISFVFFNEIWPLEPKTIFYDWIYMNALHKNKDLSKEIIKFNAFTDIEFNHNKSINCQAYSAALYVSLSKNCLIERALSSKDDYLRIINNNCFNNK